MGYGPLFHGLMHLYYVAETDFTNCSGFYGPGAVLAWLLTTVLTIFSYLKEKKIDQAGFTAVFAYVSIAAFDAILRLSKGEHDPPVRRSNDGVNILDVACHDLSQLDRRATPFS